VKGLRYIHNKTSTEIANSVGAQLIKNSIIYITLAHTARVLADVQFTSRDDVNYMREMVNTAFDAAEEQAADEMAQESYRALIELRSSMIYFLTETARPLPRMLAWEFSQVMSTLILAQRLYYDASRADELREENHIVHPAFCPRVGRALSK
jgi:prophage DNA circulation protein